MGKFTVDPRAYSEPCGCGTPAGMDCPHTPIRCQHDWSYELAPRYRQCNWCGFAQKQVLKWEVAGRAYPPSDEDVPLGHPVRRKPTTPRAGQEG